MHLDDVALDIVHGDRSPRKVPIYIGATGMQMMELAGQIGDGVAAELHGRPRSTPRGRWRRWPPARSGPGARVDDIDRPQLVVCSMDRDRDLALDRARELLTQYLGQQPHIMKASGVDPALIEAIGKVLTWPASPEEIRKAMKLVPDDAVQAISASGTPEECQAKVGEYIANGATCPILYPLGDDVRLMIDTFGTAEGSGNAR